MLNFLQVKPLETKSFSGCHVYVFHLSVIPGERWTKYNASDTEQSGQSGKWALDLYQLNTIFSSYFCTNMQWGVDIF